MHTPYQPAPAPVHTSYQPAPAPLAPPAPVPPPNALAIVAFMFGMLGVGLPAVICGLLGRRQIDRSRGAERGRWMATTGLILGVVFTALDVLLMWAVFIAIHSVTQYLGS